MALQIGIVGLPNVGKSTLFQALTKTAVPAENFPFCTIDPNVGVVAVPDERLHALSPLVKTDTVVPTTIEFVDIAGLVAGAHKGEGLGNQFLQHIRQVDAIAEVIRVFDDPNVLHVAGKVDPTDDMETIHLELMMADMQVLEKLMHNADKKARGQDKDAIEELEVMKLLWDALEKGALANTVELTEKQEVIARGFQLLTKKPFLFIANVEEGSAENVGALPPAIAAKNPVLISAKIEAELAQLEDADRAELMEGYGMTETGLTKLIRAGYETLNLRTYFTAGEKEVHAWTITAGDTAPVAAGKIHSDFEEKFIRAEVSHYADFVETGGWVGAKEKGKVQMEGKEYVVEDGDVMVFHHS